MEVPRYVARSQPSRRPYGLGTGGQSGYGERGCERWGPLPPSTPPAPLRCRRCRGDAARERATNHFPVPGFILPRPPNRHRLEPFHIRRGSSDDELPSVRRTGSGGLHWLALCGRGETALGLGHELATNDDGPANTDPDGQHGATPVTCEKADGTGPGSTYGSEGWGFESHQGRWANRGGHRSNPGRAASAQIAAPPRARQRERSVRGREAGPDRSRCAPGTPRYFMRPSATSWNVARAMLTFIRCALKVRGKPFEGSEAHPGPVPRRGRRKKKRRRWRGERSRTAKMPPDSRGAPAPRRSRRLWRRCAP